MAAGVNVKALFLQFDSSAHHTFAPLICRYCLVLKAATDGALGLYYETGREGHKKGGNNGAAPNGLRCNKLYMGGYPVGAQVKLDFLKIDRGAWDVIGVIEYISCSQ